MKKILLVILLILTIGCTNKKQIFEKNAQTYYKRHMQMINEIDSVTITLEDLEKVSKEDNLDLKKLKKCKKTSTITLYIDKETKKIKKTEIELNC